MSKPAGPTPPDGYKWVPKGQIVWPDDRRCDMRCGLGVLTTRADAWRAEWSPAENDFLWMRLKVTQPDLQWLKAKAVRHVESLPEHLDREKARWQIAQAVQLYSQTLMAMLPQQERYRPDQKREGGAA